MTTATRSVTKHVYDWSELEAAIKSGQSPTKISQEGADNALWINDIKHSSETYVQLNDRVFATCYGRPCISLHYVHRIPGTSSRMRLHHANAYPAAQGRTMYEVIGKQMHWFAERCLPSMDLFRKHNGCRTRIYGQKGVYQMGDGPVYEHTGMAPSKPLLPIALESLKSFGANDAMMQAASVLAGQIEEKVAPYNDCVVRYNVEERVGDMYFQSTVPAEVEQRFRRHRRMDYIQLPASMVFDCLLYHPKRLLDARSGYSQSWHEPPAMRVGVCLLDKFIDAEPQPLYHICAVNPGSTYHHFPDDEFPLLETMLTQHMHKLWTPVTEWLAQNVYVPGG
jgi:hypothetical protein